MKKFLILFIFVISFALRSVVFAADSNVDINKPLYPAGSKDEKGCYTSGVLYNVSNLESDWCWQFTVSGSNLYLVSDSDNAVLYLYGENITVQAFKSVDHVVYEKWQKSYSHNSGDVIYNESDKQRRHYFTSLPVFDKSKSDFKNSVKKYLENGDTSGATNAKELNEKYTDKYDNSIPLPQNLKVVSGVDQTITGTRIEKLGAFNKDIVLTWEQPEIPDGMQFEIEAEFSAKRLADDNYSDYKEYTGEYHTVVQKTAYGETSTVTVSVDHKTMNAMKEKGFLTKVNFRVRNCINNKTSDWVLVTVDIANKTATATQQGYEDNSNTGGDTYNDTNVDASDNNKNVVDSSNINFGSLSNFIKDGFGLIGNGGIITLMSRTFIFLPGTFWTIIYFFVSMLVFVCVIKLIKDVIF